LIKNFKLSNCANIDTLFLGELVRIDGKLDLLGIGKITSLNLSEVVEINGNVTIDSCSLLTSIDLSELVKIYNAIVSISTCTNLATLSLSKLEKIKDGTLVTANAVITTFSLPLLEILDNSSVNNNGNNSLTEISLPSLDTMINSSSINISQCGNITTLSLPALVTVDLSSGIYKGDSNSLETVTIGTIDTLKTFNTGLDLSGQALTQVCVDGILAVFATLDGTNETTLFEQTIDLSGGTNAIPSAAGLISKGIIEANGGTVNVNS
jgi:hypothetical protein